MTPLDALRRHWPEYLIEGAGLGVFLISAGSFGTLLEYPGSPVHRAIEEPMARRMLMGLAMGLTAIAIIYSPWGRQSGAHLNPAVTLTFLRLGKVAPWDAMFYVLAQFAGGLAGVMLMMFVLGLAFTDPPVRCVATMPGPHGAGIAFLAETLMTFGLMLMILFTTNSARAMRYTGIFAGCLVATYITFEAPYSGMSMNPARTFASALPAGLWSALWVYFTAPLLGMLAAVEVYRAVRGTASVACAKLNHHTTRRCIFHCHYHALTASEDSLPQPALEERTCRTSP